MLVIMVVVEKKGERGHGFCGMFLCVRNISALAGSTKHSGLHLSFSSLYCSHASIHHNRSNRSFFNITMFTSFIANTCKLHVFANTCKPYKVCPAADLNWQTFTIVFVI